MRFSILGLWLLATTALAADPVSFRNDREGTSLYSSNSHKKAMAKALHEVDQTQIKGAFDEVLRHSDKNKLCSFDLNKSFLAKLKEINPKFTEYNGAIYHLRTENEIDDSVVKILTDAHNVLTTDPLLPKDPERLFLPKKDKVLELLPVIASFEKKYLKVACFDEAYRNMYSDLVKADKTIKTSQVEALLVKAYESKIINLDTFLNLEKARLNELEIAGLSLKNYYQKVSNLRIQYPLRDSTEQSTFVTQKVDKMKVSRRQRLLESYSDLQIILMGNVIKKLRTRLDSQKVEILIYDREQGIETLTLEPMERFRLAIKLLRKEMSLLSLNTYFNGRTPDYLDLMTAAYEVGIIPASELDELAGLQDIWNPKKTFWEKARVWVTTFSSVATIVIPPPYGFIPALAIVVIEATAGKKSDPNAEDPTSLF
jgi:hypothetical protein